VEKWMYQWAEEAGQAQGIKYAEAYRVMILQDEEDKG